MALTEAERERIELENADAQRNPADAISMAVGQSVFAHNHRFPELRARAWRDANVTSSGLTVSRFYFGARPQVVVDIVAQPVRAKIAIRAKRAYCAEHGIRYVLVPDAYADEAVREQLQAFARPAPKAPGKPPRRPVAQKRARAAA